MALQQRLPWVTPNPPRSCQKWQMPPPLCSPALAAGAARSGTAKEGRICPRCPTPPAEPTLVLHRSSRHQALAQWGEGSQNPREYRCEAKGRGEKVILVQNIGFFFFF